MLAEPDIRDMHAAGMEVGSHSRRHALLPGLPASELQDEVQRSRSDIEQVIGAAVTGFSYPYGRYDDAAVAAVQAAGYSAACSTRPGVHRPGESLTVRRLSIHNDDTPARLARKLAFADNRCEWPFVARYYGSRLARRLGLPGDPPGSAP
jgi:peptidoglycan/xylan/chitin deacetylase (PgdA/CDA1 family)